MNAVVFGLIFNPERIEKRIDARTAGFDCVGSPMLFGKKTIGGKSFTQTYVLGKKDFVRQESLRSFSNSIFQNKVVARTMTLLIFLIGVKTI